MFSTRQKLAINTVRASFAITRANIKIHPLLVIFLFMGLFGVQVSQSSSPSLDIAWCLESYDTYVYDEFDHIDISLVAYIIRRTNGTGGLTQEVVIAELDSMASHFATWNIRFVVNEIQYVDNDSIYSNNPSYSIFTQYDPEALNIYFGPIGGPQVTTASGIGGNIVVLGEGFLPYLFESFLDNGLLTHEVGHLLGLFHPCGPLADPLYQEWPWSDYSNLCDYCGDHVYDTPASPNLIYGNAPNYLTNVDCAYSPPAPINPCDHDDPNYLDCFTEFNPNTTNFMEYAHRGCWSHFTEGQAVRMSACVIQEFVSRGIAKVVKSNTQYINKSTSTNLDFDGTPYGSVVLDYNQDGKTDLFVSIKDMGAALYRCISMTGDGVPYFENATNSAFGANSPQSGLRGLTVADIANDGNDDLFAAAATNARLYCSYYDTTQSLWKFVDMASTVGISAYITDTWSGAWGDYDQDGDVDLYVTRAQTSGGTQTPNATNVYPLRDYLLKNDLNINGQFVDTSSSADGMTTNVFATLTASWTDIDDDSDIDLLVPSMDYNAYDTAKLYINNGNGTFSQNFTTRFGEPNLLYVSGISWFDADNDADIDVAFSTQPPSGTPNQRIYTNEVGYFTEVPIDLNLYSSGVNAYDHDLDGRMDLLYSPMSNSDSPHLLQNISDTAGFECRDITTTSGLAEIGRVDGVVISDFNRGGANTDGDLDLFLGRPESSRKYYFRASKSTDLSDTPDNHSASVKIFSGGPNNAAAIGTRVVASYNGIEQVQQIDGGSGRGGQNDRILTFGLGDYDGSVDLTIKWPLGYTQYETISADSIDTGRPVEFEDETPITVVTNSLQVDFVHQPLDGKLEWTLIWDTNYNSKSLLDAAEIDGPDWATPWVVYPQTSQVVRLAGGGFRHTMVISDFECATGTYTFRVRSSTDATTGAWSGEKTKAVKFCLAN